MRRATTALRARGSALECRAILDAPRVLGLIPADVASRVRAHVVRLAQMLRRRCR
jgi:hypothetical protein